MNSHKPISASSWPAQADPFPERWDLSAEVAHEIRNPLQTAKAIMQLMNGKYSQDKTFLYYSQLVVKELDDANEILTACLNLDRDRSEPTLCSLAELCHGAVTLIQGVAILQEINMVEDYVDIPPLLLERKSLQQILVNLLKNSLDACSPGGTITVSAVMEADLVLIRVADDGIGMDEQTMENIFKPFYTTKKEGSGLGLSICRHMMENLRGSLTAESVLGQGAVFTLAFPAVRPNEKEKQRR
ncbi:MAG: HAMP domain-containing histidine kinase [Clostridiales bacterium]|nr:HAMP domain-containing histidine kinase [Clostridiales bacterium]